MLPCSHNNLLNWHTGASNQHILVFLISKCQLRISNTIRHITHTYSCVHSNRITGELIYSVQGCRILQSSFHQQHTRALIQNLTGKGRSNHIQKKKNALAPHCINLPQSESSSDYIEWSTHLSVDSKAYKSQKFLHTRKETHPQDSRSRNP